MHGATGGKSQAPAPELAVSSIDPEPVTIARLTAGGPALLLFVSEECPTSAMALRKLGPLCPALDDGGLSCTAIFEDPLEIALRVARNCGWGGRGGSQAPPYQASRQYGLISVPTTVLIGKDGSIAASVTGWDQPALTDLIRTAGADLPVPAATEPLRKPGCSSKAANDPELAVAMTSASSDDELEEMFERGWTDGLPVIPPTTERVHRMLGRFDAGESLGEVPPSMGEATMRRLAACAGLA